MLFDYEELEEKLVAACNEVHRVYVEKFVADDIYFAGRGQKLDSFMLGLQREFETATLVFLKKHNIHNDAEAKKRAFTITKLYAKRCVDDFSKV
ncbi:MAG: hypothetical protein EOO45_31190 [Flavobacterium sp.]|nr:MAG: hypothetical protein EOO45_31190 [Flavobacterium sp.]